MFAQLSQYNDIGLFLLRLTVAVIFIYHSWPKLRNAKIMAQGIGWPVSTVFALGAVEFLSAIGLALGIYIRVAALFLAVTMLGATIIKIHKWHVPFYAKNTTGWEFDFILWAANILILLGGGGTIAIQ